MISSDKGAIVATLGTGLIGTLSTAGSIFIAPSALTGLGIGLAVGVAKFGYRHRPKLLRGLIPVFAGASGATIGGEHTDVPERHGSFLSWASARAHSGASPRQDEQKENDEVEEGMKKDVEDELRIIADGVAVAHGGRNPANLKNNVGLYRRADKLIAIGLLQVGIKGVVGAVGAICEQVEIIAASAVGDEDIMRRENLRRNGRGWRRRGCGLLGLSGWDDDERPGKNNANGLSNGVEHDVPPGHYLS